MLSGLGVVAVLLAASPSPALAQATSDVDAIQALLDQAVAITNNASLTRSQKAALSLTMHRPDGTYAAGDLPIYFGPTSAPVVRGATAFIDSVLANQAGYETGGYRFETRIHEMQIHVEGRLGVAIVRPAGVIIASDGRILGEALGRWTVVLQKASDNRWYIAHEHMSFFNPPGSTTGGSPLTQAINAAAEAEKEEGR
jgi:ketosteroid isomerase-like protein